MLFDVVSMRFSLLTAHASSDFQAQVSTAHRYQKEVAEDQEAGHELLGFLELPVTAQAEEWKRAFKTVPPRRVVARMHYHTAKALDVQDAKLHESLKYRNFVTLGADWSVLP